MSYNRLANILRTEGYSNKTNTPTRKIEKTIDELNALLNKTDDFELKNAVLTQLIDKTGMLDSPYWSNKKQEYETQKTDLNKLEYLLLTSNTNISENEKQMVLKRLSQEDPSGPRRSSSVASDPSNFSTGISNAEQARWNALNRAVSLGGPSGPNHKGGRKRTRRHKNLITKTRSKRH